MFGVRLTSLFTSRWMALAWAVLVCLTAIGYVGGRGGDDDDAQARQDAATAKAVDGALSAMH